MASNRKKVMVPHTMGREGVALLQRRDDIEVVEFPAGITQADLLPMLSDVAGIALGGTPYRRRSLMPRRRWRWWRASASATTRWRCRR